MYLDLETLPKISRFTFDFYNRAERSVFGKTWVVPTPARKVMDSMPFMFISLVLFYLRNEPSATTDAFWLDMER